MIRCIILCSEKVFVAEGFAYLPLLFPRLYLQCSCSIYIFEVIKVLKEKLILSLNNRIVPSPYADKSSSCWQR